MILIASSSNDKSTSIVIDWIKSKTLLDIIRIDDDLNYAITFVGKEIVISTDGLQIKMADIKAYWHRRGRIRFKYPEETLTFSQKDEEEELEQYIEKKLLDRKSLGNYQKSTVNKLIVLEEAISAGLLVPDTYLFESFNDMTEFQNDELITKSYLQNSMFDIGTETAAIYTNSVRIEDSELTFAPSLFQKKIEKLFELRIFYLKGKFWSMAIFSQEDKQTSVDFRRYNTEMPNKNVPFNLPGEIEEKLENLMCRLDLDTGSIDMIVSDKNEFIFLEVNPIGQFGMVSFPCNYYLEEEIANYLIYGL